MISVKPVSDLRKYSEVLHDVEDGSPVMLTQDGHNRYVVLSAHDYEKNEAGKKLLSELRKGEESAAKYGWLTPEQVDDMLGL